MVYPHTYKHKIIHTINTKSTGPVDFVLTKLKMGLFG